MSWFKKISTPRVHQCDSQSEHNYELEQPDHVPESKDEEIQYPGRKVVLPSVISICFAAFLTSLDRTIIGVAVPAISNHFKSFNDIAWYETAYLLTNSASQLPLGKIYTYYPAKWVFIITVIIFEIGSIICAAAPTSNAFIVGRAIAGLGSSGAFNGAAIIFVDLLPLEKRPKYQGLLGAMFGLASVAGPLLGGVFTSKASWRWCFWINVPVGGVALLVIFLCLPANPPAKKHVGNSIRERFWSLDPIGTSLIVPALVSLLLGLQWGGNGDGWGSTKVVVTLVLGSILLLLWIFSQWWAGDNGTVPPRILCQRSIAAGVCLSVGFGSVLTITTFYLPIWYEAVKGLSAYQAGLRLLGNFLGAVVFVIGGGILVSKTGYYVPPLFAGTALLIVGCGLFTTFNVDTSTARSVGYQVVTGAGIGLILPQPNNAAQCVLPRKDLPAAFTLLAFSLFFGGTVFVSVCQAILQTTLQSQLSNKIPGLDYTKLSGAGATSIATLIPPEYLPEFYQAYNKGIVNVFYCTLGLACLAFVSSFFFEWKSVKKQQPTVGANV